MTPEEYIEKLKEAQRTLDSVKEDLDRAIDKMQRRIETVNESMEQEKSMQRQRQKLSIDIKHHHNMAKIGVVIGLLSIPVASMTNRFGFGQIPQLLGGIMAIGGALMALNYILKPIMFDDK